VRLLYLFNDNISLFIEMREYLKIIVWIFMVYLYISSNVAYIMLCKPTHVFPTLNINYKTCLSILTNS